MDENRKHYPLYDAEDSLTSLVSSFELTGSVPSPPGTEPEADNFAALAGVPIQSTEAAERYKEKLDKQRRQS